LPSPDAALSISSTRPIVVGPLRDAIRIVVGSALADAALKVGGAAGVVPPQPASRATSASPPAAARATRFMALGPSVGWTSRLVPGRRVGAGVRRICSDAALRKHSTN